MTETNQTLTTSTDLNKRKQTLLNLEGDWIKTATYYRLLITKYDPWRALAEFYDCGAPTKTVTVNGANGEQTHQTRPAIKEYIVKYATNIDPRLLLLFSHDETTTLYFPERRDADNFKTQVQQFIEYLLNDSNRLRAAKTTHTISIQQD